MADAGLTIQYFGGDTLVVGVGVGVVGEKEEGSSLMSLASLVSLASLTSLATTVTNRSLS